jgi:adenylyl-sulfate kinase
MVADPAPPWLMPRLAALASVSVPPCCPSPKPQAFANVFLMPIVPVSRAERDARQVHPGAVVWLTGLSGAGKSTLATALERHLFDRGCRVIVLDGDVMRTGLSSDLGFSRADRAENIRRLGEVAALLADAGLIVITALISPYAADRARARQRLTEVNAALSFIEVYVDAPLDVCEARDPKGLYARARSGRLAGFTGVSDPYESPVAPDVHLRTDNEPLAACVARVADRVQTTCGTDA